MFTALTLATDPISPALLNQILDKQTMPLFTVNMYKQILLQSVYQIKIILLFHFLSVKILGFELTSANDTIVRTVVFNMYIHLRLNFQFGKLMAARPQAEYLRRHT